MDVVVVAAIVTNGLLAGLFFAFSVGVAPGLRQVGDEVYVRSFRAVNTAIVNPVFLAVFFGAPLLATAVAIARPTPWFVAAAACSAVTFVITSAANVPLNRGLGQAALRGPGELTAARRAFETAWNRWNDGRTVTAVLACALLALGVVS